MVDAWQTLKVTRTSDPRPGMWIFEEPLFYNDFLKNTTLSSTTLRSKFVEAGIVKLGHLIKASLETLGGITNIRSSRVLRRIVEEVWQSLSVPLRAFAENRALADQWNDDNEYVFPSLNVSSSVEGWREESGKLLSLKTPVLGNFSTCGKKQLYHGCVKILNFRSLVDIKESRWSGVFGTDWSPKGSWRVLYKPPVEKRTADLQWRIIHGALATNKHRAHLDPSTGEGCPFCQERETLEHLVVSCPRLVDLLKLLHKWVEALGEKFSVPLFVYGPKYVVRRRQALILINYLLGASKLAIWKTRKNQMLGQGWTDVVQSLKGLVAVRLRVEHAFYTLTSNLDAFKALWGIGQVLCSLGEDGSLVLNF